MARKSLTEAQQAFRKTGQINSVAPFNDSTSGDNTNSFHTSPSIIKIPLSQLKAWVNQPRTYFPPEHIQQLALSIKRQGLTYPLIIRPISHGYEVIVGECRLQACQLADYDPVECVIEDLNDAQALELALSENLERKDLNPVEILNSLLSLLSSRLNLDEQNICSFLYEMKREWESSKNKLGDIDIPDEKNPHQKLVNDTFNQYGYHWYSFTCNQLKLRNLPDVIYSAIADGRIEYSKGLKFKSIKDPITQTQLLEQAIREGWSQRTITEKIKEVLGAKKLNNEEKQENPASRIQGLTNRLKKGKLWKSNPKAWKKVETKIKHLETLLEELEQEIS